MEAKNDRLSEQTSSPALEDTQLEHVCGGSGYDPRNGCPDCGSFQIVRVIGGFKCLDCGRIF